MLIRVRDLDRSRSFYETVLASLEHERSGEGGDRWNDLVIAPASEERPPTAGLHLAFVARSRDEVDAFWRVGTAAGFASDGEPGPRPEYHADYYGGFLLDPDGNSVEAVYHGEPRTGENVIDHLWIRVADLDESARFYGAIAPSLGLHLRGAREERFHVARGDRSFALVRGGVPTRHVHMAFPADGEAAVAAFHRAALAAGRRDNGVVRDPDGNSIEAVEHRYGA